MDKLYGSRLTGRQVETVQLMMKGLLVKEIAHQMGISERTVKEFRVQAMERLGAKTAAQLVAKYLARADL